ncbi:phage tail protein [Niameybacter massiliensis]|uniref:Phage tail protein n=1 Tax=Holtiella tumoricola TaxID=3018743 RepID=A0AA42DPE0_9FIRM|nr:phage tail protein [Holtiella tumoricola]MDA3732396.1 phage tail protein [Holtiella tumoricola]
MELGNVNVLTLQTSAMKQDKTTQAMSLVLTEILNEIDIGRSLIRTQLEDLSEEVLDTIAIERNIFWYDANANADIKRNIIRNCNKVFRTLGTNYAIEQVIADYFGDGQIEEWYEYDGQPYHFRVLTTNTKVTGELADQFHKAVEAVKRKSTRLHEVLVMMSANLNLYYGFVVHTGDKIIIRQEG